MIARLLAHAALFAIAGADAADTPRTSEEPVDVEVFKGASLVSAPGATYPASEVWNGHEGFVRLNMMIDPKGKAYQITVVESMGGAPFEANAVKAAETATFRPAMNGTTPVDSGMMVTLHFVHGDTPSKSASREFAHTYRDLLKAVRAEDKPAADALLPKLEARNFYEYAYQGAVLYEYHLKWGTEAEQLADLRLALANEDPKARHLDTQTYVSAANRLLLLQLKRNDFGSALQTWKGLLAIAPKDLIGHFQSTMDQIDALRKDNRPVHLSAEIDKGTTWLDYLFKKSFHVVVLSGQVSEIKLRCDRKYVFFHYQPDVLYTVGEKAGDCTIEIVGEPGTRFDLVQS